MKKENFEEIKKDFEEIKKQYEDRRRYLEGISVGDIVWDFVPRGGIEIDYHPAVVKEVNIDEDYVEVIDVSSENEFKRYTTFLIEEEMIRDYGFNKENLDKEKERYSKTIESVITATKSP